MDQAGRGDDVEQWIAQAAVMTQNMDRGREDAKKIDRAKDVDDVEDGSRERGRRRKMDRADGVDDAEYGPRG